MIKLIRNYKRRYFSQSGYSYLQSCMLILIQRFYIDTLLKELLYLLQLSLLACLMEEHSLRCHLLSHRELVNEAAASSFHPKVRCHYYRQNEEIFWIFRSELR